jgi:DNA-binding transcriptional LysR family regulator
MIRNLDLTALRSFVAVADEGGVTRAAGFLNLTQSAVSMQIKRLEDMLGAQILDRSARKVALTGAGEQLLGYARKMINLNDEVFGRLTHAAYEGEIVLGVPHDIVYPLIPQVMRRFAREFPKMRIILQSSFTRILQDQFSRGECDVMLTTERALGADGEELAELPLVWVGAPGGHIWRQRPLPLAYEQACIFRQEVQASLDRAGIAWEMVVVSQNTRSVEATVSADLAVHTVLSGSEPRHVERIAHGGALPELLRMKIGLYLPQTAGPVQIALAQMLRAAFAGHKQTGPVSVAAE